MANPIRTVILRAIEAGRFESPADAELARRILAGDDVPLETLGFDSLAWMEFCISVELNSGADITPEDIEGMRSVSEIETWIHATKAS